MLQGFSSNSESPISGANFFRNTPLDDYLTPVREHQQKTFVTLNGFWWAVKGVRGFNESVRKGKIETKIFFSNSVEGISKNL